MGRGERIFQAVAFVSAAALAQGQESRLVDGGEGVLTWEDGKLGAPSVVRSLRTDAGEAKAGTKAVAVVLDSLDGTRDTLTQSWPRQAGVQTNAIPAACADLSGAKRISISLKAVQADPAGSAWLQARLYLKTGDGWLWHTTEERDGKQAMSNVTEGDWITLERDVGDFYASGDSAAGVRHPTQLKSVGIQFFTYNGPWSGTVYIDEVRLVDVVPDPVPVRKGTVFRRGRTGEPPAFGGARLDGRRFRAAPSAR